MKTVVVIRLEIEGDALAAFEAVDRELDAGTLQDAVNDSDAGPLKVLSATCGGSEMVRALAKELGA